MSGSDDGTSSERKLIEEYQAGAGIAFQSLEGSTPGKARAECIAAIQAEQGDVFLISLKAGGVGLNLTAADYVIHPNGAHS
ncbi:MAG: C-terminal helicase domain-containing protein [Bryobacterales bacterium]|nr:C-terminal helicase domain-containing protein [Bryobacterales bacterium]